MNINIIKSDFNYSIQEEHIIGNWDVPGSDNSSLNSPSHIYLNENSYYISDSKNCRLVIVDRITWKISAIIEPYCQEGINPQISFSNLYQTVVTQSDNFYSLVDGPRIIHYNSSGIILNEFALPVAEEGNSSDYISLGIDNSITTPIILIRFIQYNASGSPSTLEKVVYKINQDLNESSFDLIRLNYYMNPTAHFSYNGTHPVLIENQLMPDDTFKMKLVEYGPTADGYGIEQTNLSNDPDNLAITTQAWTRFSNGYCFSKLVSGGRNIITTLSLEIAGELASLGNQGELYSISSLSYDSRSDLVIIVLKTRHVVFALHFLDISAITTTTQPSLATGSPEIRFLADFLMIISSPQGILVGLFSILAISFLLVKRYKKKNDKQKTDDT